MMIRIILYLSNKDEHLNNNSVYLSFRAVLLVVKNSIRIFQHRNFNPNYEFWREESNLWSYFEGTNKSFSIVSSYLNFPGLNVDG